MPLPVADSQLGVYFGDILGDQAIIENWARILKVLLKPEGDRFQLVEQLAGFVHGLNILLVASRGSDVTKLTAR